MQTASMETGRSFGQKHAATREEVEEETVVQNTVELANEEGLECVNPYLTNVENSVSS